MGSWDCCRDSDGGESSSSPSSLFSSRTCRIFFQTILRDVQTKIFNIQQNIHKTQVLCDCSFTFKAEITQQYSCYRIVKISHCCNASWNRLTEPNCERNLVVLCSVLRTLVSVDDVILCLHLGTKLTWWGLENITAWIKIHVLMPGKCFPKERTGPAARGRRREDVNQRCGCFVGMCVWALLRKWHWWGALWEV